MVHFLADDVLSFDLLSLANKTISYCWYFRERRGRNCERSEMDPHEVIDINGDDELDDEEVRPFLSPGPVCSSLIKGSFLESKCFANDISIM